MSNVRVENVDRSWTVTKIVAIVVAILGGSGQELNRGYVAPTGSATQWACTRSPARLDHRGLDLGPRDVAARAAARGQRLTHGRTVGP